ncbi:MAG TPA: molecular chaperone TorD family protein [Hyphomicrobiaceae bacterium]|nr:molecular chaperone TorD family protein [Hyphomicrobiaceae bacterium]
MTDATTTTTVEVPTWRDIAIAAAADLDLLALLHDREPTRAVLVTLAEHPLEAAFWLRLTTKEAQAALSGMRAAVAALPSPLDDATVDELAAGYADVYLRYAFRASPTESVWLTEDGLERQAPMFLVREQYRRQGLKIADPAGRPEDHLVFQLRFVARQLKQAEGLAELKAVARFLDGHILRWIRRFASQLLRAGAPDFFTALALVTATYLDELRDHLTAVTGVARRQVGESPAIGPDRKTNRAEEDRPYVPGIGPSW